MSGGRKPQALHLHLGCFFLPPCCLQEHLIFRPSKKKTSKRGFSISKQSPLGEQSLDSMPSQGQRGSQGKAAVLGLSLELGMGKWGSGLCLGGLGGQGKAGGVFREKGLNLSPAKITKTFN